MNLAASLAALQTAKCPEDIFGIDPAGIAESFRDWAKRVHEDLFPAKDKATAHAAFLVLQKLREEADAKVAKGSYGNKRPLVIATLSTKTASYNLTALLQEGDIADLYQGETDKGTSVIVKVCRSPVDNDLMKNEADILAGFPATLDPKHAGYFPNLLDSFEMLDNRVKTRVNVFSFTAGAVSLAQVYEAYPDGIEPADAAWMWNRMLESLHLLHRAGYVHGAVTPDRFIIVPETHQGCLIDFCFTVKNGAKVKAISDEWIDFYPAEILTKNPVDSSSDLYMASMCMRHIMKADLVPLRIGNLTRALRLGQAHREKSAKAVHEDFKKECERAFGPKKFRVFTMPAKS